MKTYQLNYLLSLELSEAETSQTAQKIESALAELGGIIEKSETPIKKELGTAINNQTLTFFGLINFSLAQEQLEILKQKITAMHEVTRFMLVNRRPAKERTKPPRTFDKAKWTPKKEAKVEMMDIEKKLGEILGE